MFLDIIEKFLAKNWKYALRFRRDISRKKFPDSLFLKLFRRVWAKTLGCFGWRNLIRLVTAPFCVSRGRSEGNCFLSKFIFLYVYTYFENFFEHQWKSFVRVVKLHSTCPRTFNGNFKEKCHLYNQNLTLSGKKYV